jgi:hypothetical protein
MRHLVTALSIIVCGLGTFVLAVMFTLVGCAQNTRGTCVVLGVWASSPYLAMALMSLAFRKRRAAAIVLFLGSLAVIAPGLYVICYDLRFAFRPLPPGTGHSVGPLLELAVPAIQWAGVGILALIASGVARWSRGG